MFVVIVLTFDRRKRNCFKYHSNGLNFVFAAVVVFRETVARLVESSEDDGWMKIYREDKESNKSFLRKMFKQKFKEMSRKLKQYF